MQIVYFLWFQIWWTAFWNDFGLSFFPHWHLISIDIIAISKMLVSLSRLGFISLTFQRNVTRWLDFKGQLSCINHFFFIGHRWEDCDMKWLGISLQRTRAGFTLYAPLSWQEQLTLTLAQKWKYANVNKQLASSTMEKFNRAHLKWKKKKNGQRRAQCMLQTLWLQSEPFETFFGNQIVFWMQRKCVAPGAAPYEHSTLYHKTCRETH